MSKSKSMSKSMSMIKNKNWEPIGPMTLEGRGR